MLQWFARRMKEAKEDEKGFTLIELLIVVIIIGILMGITVPIYLNQREDAQDRAAQANIRSAAGAQQPYHVDEGNGSYTDNASDELRYYGFSPGNPVVAFEDIGDATFCAVATSDANNIFHMTQDTGNPTDEPCP